MAANGPITRFVGDEQPDYVETFYSNGVYPDFSTGWTFTLKVVSAGVTLLTKTTGITGATGGVVTCVITDTELSTNGITATFAANNISYPMFLTARRTSDSSDLTAERTLLMKWRP